MNGQNGPSNVAHYLASEISRRRDLRAQLDELALSMPRDLARTKWWLLIALAIASACALTAFATLQMSHMQSIAGTLRDQAIDENLTEAARIAAAKKLAETARLNVDALKTVAASPAKDVSAIAVDALAKLREKLPPN